MLIEPLKKYSKKEIMLLLKFNEKQLKVAEEKKLLVFHDNSMYGVYFFQFLKLNHIALENIQSII